MRGQNKNCHERFPTCEGREGNHIMNSNASVSSAMLSFFGSRGISAPTDPEPVALHVERLERICATLPTSSPNTSKGALIKETFAGFSAVYAVCYCLTYDKQYRMGGTPKDLLRNTAENLARALSS